MTIIRKVKKVYRLLSLPGALKYILKMIYPSVEHMHLIKIFDKINTVVDIGANKGQFSSLIRILFPNAFIYAFEPLNNPAIFFKKAFKDDNHTKLFNLAIGPTDEIEEIHVSRREDSSSILPITELQVINFPGTEEIKTEQVVQKRLISVLDSICICKPALLKIDVQGYELQVLEGSKELLQYFDWIYVECSFAELYKGQALAWEIISSLSDHKFKLVGVYNIFYQNGVAIQGDFLFKQNFEKL